jgi:tetratricopeptide (TPR) repeat protein
MGDVDYKSQVARVESYLDRDEHAKARHELEAMLQLPPPGKERTRALWDAKLAGFLIDVGFGSKDESMIRRGLDWHLSSLEVWAKHITRSSLEYNIGNAFKDLYDLDCAMNPRPFRVDKIALLTEAKSHYWRAYKTNVAGLQADMCVNLGNCLNASGRVVESLHWCNEALRIQPNFEMAWVNKAKSLVFLNRISGTFSIKQIKLAIDLFQKALASQRLSPNVAVEVRYELSRLEAWLEKLVQRGRRTEASEESASESELTPYRRFCIRNGLALSEHGLYCPCSAAASDDLVIPLSSTSIGGAFVPRMQLLANRLKAEFSLARLAYYHATQAPKAHSWPTEPYDVLLTELDEGEAVGTEAELLRMSFRLCFGILDKIAWGVCDLFGLRSLNEEVYFERFWKSPKAPDRWKRINEIQNLPLVALYSIATDLNARSGEWGEFKAWRNGLEHELFIVADRPDLARQFQDLFGEGRSIPIVSLDDFIEHTLHLLQLTASAIFCFIYCVRVEGAKALEARPSGSLDPEMEGASRGQIRVTFNHKRKKTRTRYMRSSR